MSHMDTAQLPAWDLSPLIPEADVQARLTDAVSRAQALESRWRGRLASANRSEIIEILDEIGQIQQVVRRPAAYLTLKFADGSGDEDDLPLEALVAETSTNANNALEFFISECGTVPETLSLGPYSSYIAGLRHSVAHRLDPGQERMLALREGLAQAWIDLHEEETASLEIRVNNHSLTVEEAIALLHHPDPAHRRAAFEELGSALSSRADLFARCLDALVADRLNIDHVRGYPGPRAERDLENELSSQAVDEMLAVVESVMHVAHSWWHTKARLLGIDRLQAADLRAPVGAGLQIPFSTATDLIITALTKLTPTLAEPIHQVLRMSAIDAVSRPGKAGNAFCLLPSPNDAPYILFNYGGTPRDLIQLAHELGHAVHYSLSARQQPPLVAEAGLIPSELAAFIIEGVVADHAEQVLDGEDREAFRAARADYSFDAVYRQVAITRWEDRIYAARSAGERLTAQRLAAHWLTENSRLLGDAVSLSDSYGHDWARISQVFQGRYHNYAYAYAFLVSLVADTDALGDYLSLGASASLADQLAVLRTPVSQESLWRNAISRLALLCS